MMKRLLLLLLLLAPLAHAADESARGMAFEVYIRLEHGMTEGDLVLRAGKPDHQSKDNVREGLKSYYYYPTTANPYLTTITLRSGRIVNIERVRRRP
ncbi:MAG: hypothetical protein RLZZ445_1555 [Pseudomonadota bacterium]|jgi:hypothetical protein